MTTDEIIAALVFGKTEGGGGGDVSFATDAEVKAGTANDKALAPSNESAASFYGLAKAAGDNTQAASSNPVGTYTAEAQAAIKSMLGVSGGGETWVTVADITTEEDLQEIVQSFSGSIAKLRITSIIPQTLETASYSLQCYPNNTVYAFGIGFATSNSKTVRSIAILSRINGLWVNYGATSAADWYGHNNSTPTQSILNYEFDITSAKITLNASGQTKTIPTGSKFKIEVVYE